jgi:hypothetical protein
MCEQCASEFLGPPVPKTYGMGGQQPSSRCRHRAPPSPASRSASCDRGQCPTIEAGAPESHDRSRLKRLAEAEKNLGNVRLS